MHVLIVEDDAKIAAFLERGLREASFTVSAVATAEDALGAVMYRDVAAVVLDMNLPGHDGMWLIERVRERGSSVPILVLSARSEVDDRVGAIRAGADDYMTKPFSFAELAARLDALLRRSQPAAIGTTRLAAGDIVVDLLSRGVTRAGRAIDLQPREFALLEYFLRNRNQVLTKTMILERIWNYDFDPQTNVVDVLVSRLRAKIDRDFGRKVIHTIRGVGYSLRPEGGGA